MNLTQEVQKCSKSKEQNRLPLIQSPHQTVDSNPTGFFHISVRKTTISRNRSKRQEPMHKIIVHWLTLIRSVPSNTNLLKKWHPFFFFFSKRAPSYNHSSAWYDNVFTWRNFSCHSQVTIIKASSSVPS